MANPDINSTGADSDLAAPFSHLSVSPPQPHGTGQDANTPSFWPTHGGSFSDQAPGTDFPTARPPPLTDPFLAAQMNTQQTPLDYGQYIEDPASQAYWHSAHDPAQAGPSSVPVAAPVKPFPCYYDGCTRAYDRQCDLECVSTCYHLVFDGWKYGLRS